MKIVTEKCYNCGKQFKSKRYIARKGLWKGHEVVQVNCSKKCSDEFDKKLALAISKEDLK